MGLSQDGYIRMYKIHERKHFEVCAQLNLQDKILAAKPLCSSRDEVSERQIAIVTQRSGVQIVTPIEEKQFVLLEELTRQMSAKLPFRGGLTPQHAI